MGAAPVRARPVRAVAVARIPARARVAALGSRRPQEQRSEGWRRDKSGGAGSPAAASLRAPEVWCRKSGGRSRGAGSPVAARRAAGIWRPEVWRPRAPLAPSRTARSLNDSGACRRHVSRRHDPLFRRRERAVIPAMTSLATTIAPSAAHCRPERLVLDAVPLIVYAVDLDGAQLLINRAWFALRSGQRRAAPCRRERVDRHVDWTRSPTSPRAHQLEHAMATCARDARSRDVRVFVLARMRRSGSRHAVSALRDGHNRHRVCLLDGGHLAESPLARGADRHRDGARPHDLRGSRRPRSHVAGCAAFRRATGSRSRSRRRPTRRRSA